MATYYRWRKSTVEYVASVDDSYSTGSLSIPNLDNKIYFCDNAPNIDENGKFITTMSRDITGEYTPQIDNNQWVSNLENPTEMYSSNVNFKATVSGSNILLTGYQDRPQATFKKTVVNTNICTFVEYVYSTSSSAYPNGGVQDGYYYDQRTTVTSPTAPTGLTYPNPITTPTVTVSWQAATSNTSYPVSYYRVAYRTTAPWNSMPEWTSENISGTNYELSIPPGTAQVKIWVYAYDTQGGSNYTTTGDTPIPVYLAPTLTVPQMVMQGQSATISWSAIEGATSYTLQRKANTDADWTQVYSGANLSYSETVGTWTTVQYRVQAVFSGTPGGWAESAAIPVVSSSALLISGTDGDLGSVVNDIPYSISTDTGNQITATITVNSAVIFSGNVGNSTSDTIPVLDLVNGEGTIVIEASVQASGGPVSAVRTWTYTKSLITFPNAGSVAQLTKEGENIFPKTLAGCVRLSGGRTLDEVMGFPCQIYAGSYVGTGTSGSSNPNTLTFPFEPKVVFIVSASGLPASGEASVLGPLVRGGAVADTAVLYPPANFSESFVTVTWESNQVSWYHGDDSLAQQNYSGAVYNFVVFG